MSRPQNPKTPKTPKPQRAYFRSKIKQRLKVKSGEVVVEEHVGALADFVDETHLEELVDDLEHEVLRVEILESSTDTLVNSIEAEPAS